MKGKKLKAYRKEIISNLISEHGFTKKRPLIDLIRSSPEHSKYFKGIGDRMVYYLVSFDEHEDIIDPGHKITGRSILKNGKGERVMEWVKTSADKQAQEDARRAALEEMRKSIEPYVAVTERIAHRKEELCNQYTVTDYHLGMMTWAEETGEEWNMELAEKLLVDWFAQAIATSVDAEQAIFANIGDFLHFDGLEAVTPASGHVLDADTRYQNLVRVSIRVIRKVIQMLLEKYKHVHLIMAEGNHDLASSAWLREVFHMYFENEPRLTVDNNPDPYYCFVWGDVCLFYHHSHKKNLKMLDSVFVSKFKKQFGSSEYVYGHTGHFHHQIQLESSLMLLEQHATLAAKDAYASRGGYASKRNSKVITYHKQFGETGRLSISPDMVK